MKRKANRQLKRKNQKRRRMMRDGDGMDTDPRNPPIGSAPETPPRTPGRPRPVFTPIEVFKGDKVGLDMRNSKSVDLYPGKKLNKTLGNYTFNTSYQGIISDIQGRQALGTAEIILCRDQLMGPTDNSRFVTTKYDTDLYKLNPFFSVPTSLYYSPTATDVVNIDMLGVRSVGISMRFISMKSFPQEVEIYWCIPKIDLDNNAQVDWETILSDKSMNQAAQAPQTTISTAPATGGAPVSNEVGQLPTKHREWRKLWRVVKHYRLGLQSGEQINIQTKIKYNKVIPRTNLVSRTSQFLAGITLYPLIIVRGALVGASSTSSTEATEVTFGAPKVGFVFNYSFKFAALGQSRINTERSYRGYLVNSVASQRILNDDEAVINPEAIANEA